MRASMTMLSRVASRVLIATLVLLVTAVSASAETLMMPKRDARTGVSMVVWGVTTQPNGTTYTMNFGDGTSTTGTVADRSYIPFNKVYATQGTFTATLTVGTEVATVAIRVFDPALLPGGAGGDANRGLGINMAIQDGLRYLWTSQSDRANNFPAGVTTNFRAGGSYDYADTALIVLAFQNHGYSLTNNNVAPTGLYEKYIVRRGLNYVLSQLSEVTLAVQTAGNPCVGSGTGWNGSDCRGLSTTTGDNHSGYGTPVAILPFAASGALSRINTEVTGATAGMTYGEVVQRLVNTVAWGQTDSGAGRGGWGYSHNGGQFDGSTVGWAILGLLDAEAAGATVPAFVRTEFKVGFDYALNTDGSFDYSADSSASSFSNTNPQKGGIGLQGLFFIGETGGARENLVKNYISSWWESQKVTTTTQQCGYQWTYYWEYDYWYGWYQQWYQYYSCWTVTSTSYVPQGIGANSWDGPPNKGSAYSMFNNFKGLKLTGISTLPGVARAAGPGTIQARDWYADYQDWLVANQQSANTTGGGDWGTINFSCCYSGTPINTAIAELILSPVALVLPDGDKFAAVGLSPGTNTALYGGSHTVTAKAESTGGTPVPGATVNFTVLTGPNAGQTGTATTNSSGLATFTYPDTGGVGTDTIQATIGTLDSNIVNMTWTPVSLSATITAANKVYDGTTAATITGCTLAGVIGGDAVTCNFGAATGTFADANVGSWSVTGTPLSLAGAKAGNYVLSSILSATANITPAPTTTVVTCAPSVTYTGTAFEVCTANVTGAGGLNAAVTPVTYTDNVNVGTAGASATYAGDANHTSSTGTASFVIRPAASTTVVTCTPSVTYTGAALEVCTANVTGAGGLNAAVTPVTYSDNVNVGTAGASATYAGDANHSSSTGTATFAITPAPTTTVVTCTPSVTYTGAAFEVCTANVTGAGGLNEGVTPVTYTDNVNVGTAGASATYAGGANHSSSTGTSSFAITPAPTTTVVTCTPSVTYTGAALEVCTANVTGAGGLNEAVTPVTYSDNVNVGTAGASATYAGGANHSSSTGTSSFAITPAATTTVVTCTASVTYTGAVLEACTANVTGAGGLNEAVTPVTYTNNVNVGTAGASATYEGDANHTGSTGSASFAITPAATTTVVTCPASVMYTSGAHAVCTANVTGAGGLNAAVTPVTYTNNVNVGTAGASATYEGDANHTGSTGTASFAITPAPLTVVANSYTRSYLAADPILTGTLAGVLGADGITATYSSTGTGSQVPGVYPTVPALVDPNGKLGNYAVTSTNGTLTITNTAPVCVIAPSISSIWPPNHKMVSITASGATDVDGGPLTYKVVSIFQDEPTNTNGDGNTAIDGAGIGTNTAQVRAERTGDPKNPGNGRVYHITFSVTDSLGLSCEATVKVGVPHDQSGKVQPIDGGPLFDSTVAGPPPAATTTGKGKGN